MKRKRCLEEEYQDIKDIKKEYEQKKEKLMKEYEPKKEKLKNDYREKIGGLFKKTQNIVNSDKEKYINIVKDWVQDYVKEKKGHEYCKKHHRGKRFKCRGYKNWYLTFGNETLISEYRICGIIVPEYIKRIAKSLNRSIVLTYYEESGYCSDMYGDKEISICITDSIDIKIK